ncbi:MAG: hypothetical protein R6W78_08120, partial [Bacteroidales bacterium]
MERVQRYSLGLGLLSLIIVILSLIFSWHTLISPFAVAASLFTAFGIGVVRVLKSYQYTGWIVAAIVCGLIYPSAFLKWGDFDLRNKWLILIVVQIVMFGMGTQMSMRDFAG